MVDEDELLELEEAARPRRKGSRRGLTIRMLAAKTEWLEGTLAWHEDRVWWQTGGETVHPEPADLAQTERTLNRIRRYPQATDLTSATARRGCGNDSRDWSWRSRWPLCAVMTSALSPAKRATESPRPSSAVPPPPRRIPLRE